MTYDSQDPKGATLFLNRIGLIPASEFCRVFGFSMKTVYDWHHRPKKNKIPNNLIVKFRGRLFFRVEVIKQLIPFNDTDMV